MKYIKKIFEYKSISVTDIIEEIGSLSYIIEDERSYKGGLLVYISCEDKGNISIEFKLNSPSSYYFSNNFDEVYNEYIDRVREIGEKYGYVTTPLEGNSAWAHIGEIRLIKK